MDVGSVERLERLGVEASAWGDADLEVAERGGVLDLVGRLGGGPRGPLRSDPA